MAKLKLPQLDTADKRELKLQITLDPFTAQDFTLYIEAYKAEYPSAEVPKQEKFAAAIIREYLSSDRNFNAYKRDRLAQSQPAAVTQLAVETQLAPASQLSQFPE